MQYSPIHPPGAPPSSIPGGSNPPPPSTTSGNHTAAHTAAHSNTQHAATAHPLAHSTPITIPNPASLMVTQNTLREAFLTLDAASISNMIQSFVAAHPSPTPLTPVVEALFEASIAEPPPYTRDPRDLVRRYLEVSTYLPSTIVHAGYSGPLAAARALQMQIRRNSIWVPSAPTPSPGSMAALRYQPHHHPTMNPIQHLAGHQHQHHHPHQQQHLQQQPQQQHPSSSSSTPIPQGGGNAQGTSSVATNSLSEEMHRIANERQRRKDHIQWARIHAASLELGLMNSLGRMSEGDGYSTGRAFSEMVARDAVWETDEAEWVAGIFVLLAVIRTATRGDRRQREEYNEMLMHYEGRWKEIKDEVRQTMVTEVLLASRDELARLEEPMA
ncbi:hypothetical protein EST38_g8973 [Candolleomyces aberdarensis]|uniref:Uncharacterized protein n=1 Tax=Candolleomyces aberdarensis TaxID=2316362 RepID=A0A4V1Q302_9AGAR|nr:hypothetical protein EST38_g8973 [Candolleomyces aberdarensis]